jgi:class 3 adenylate cyclase
MEIAAALDMERLREIITGLVERLAAVVRRFGGNVERTGDGVMALFGAPIALEDHAFRACLAALAIQEETHRLAADVARRDDVALQVRVGLNSGRVIAGEMGSGSLGYAATGHHVGMAQRMEAVAPPGGVMLSDSTASLVEHIAVLADPEWVRIKGSDDPVRARRLVAAGRRDGQVGRAEANLVGRHWEMAAIDAIVERAVGGHGGIVNVVGPPGIGKSRVAREAAAAAAGRGFDVYWSFCESHASDISFHVVSRLLRAGIGLLDLDGEAARTRVRDQVPDADPQDLLLLDDLLGIADPEVPLQIDPDARRRRLTALINTMALARTEPALFIIEDAHWIDAVSESMLADFLAVVPRTASMVLVTSRPGYEGALARLPGAQGIALAPLGDSAIAALLGELLGSDPSVAELAAVIADRAAGNPFFAEEMVRELVQRAVLSGERGSYVCRTDVAEVNVPATVQAAIEARIDSLTARAKQTLTAASVIGARFGAELLTALGIEPIFDELLDTELIDQERFGPSAQYAFHHPLIQAVAYESQLKSDRAEWHRRLAAAIQGGDPASVEENAALIAEHLESAGELHAAYGWQMRAGGWSAVRDVGAARISWERACRIADALPSDNPGQLPMRIAPRTMLCAITWQGRAIQESRRRFAELRELCDAAGDKVSLAIAMTGLAAELNYTGRLREASRFASEQMALLESIGDSTLTMGLSLVPFINWFDVGEFGEILRWSQTVIDLAEGDPHKGAGFGVGSPLAIALAFRGVAGWSLGRPGWRQDLHHANVAGRGSDAASVALLYAWTHAAGVACGALRADDAALREIEESVQNARSDSSDIALIFAEYSLGAVLLNRDSAADRHRGLEIMLRARTWLREHIPSLVPVTELFAAPERATCGDRDAAIDVSRIAVDAMYEEGRLGYFVYCTGILAGMLLERGAEGDLIEAQAAIDRLAAVPTDDAWTMRDIWLLRLRALLAGARGDDIAYRDFARRYRAFAESLGYEGHIAWAGAMISSDA